MAGQAVIVSTDPVHCSVRWTPLNTACYSTIRDADRTLPRQTKMSTTNL